MTSIAWPLVFSTFVLIFLAELPDKTALTSLVLATRYPARQVIVGACLAFLVQTFVAVAAGGLLQLLPAQLVRIAAGLGFLVFAYMAARRDVDDEEEAKAAQEEEERVAADASVQRGRPAWVTAFMMVFAAEWGDLTQLSTAALVAQTGQPLAVGLGALLALWSVTFLAVFGGAQLAQHLRPRVLKWVSAALFAVVGVVVLASAVVAIDQP